LKEEGRGNELKARKRRGGKEETDADYRRQMERRDKTLNYEGSQEEVRKSCGKISPVSLCSPPPALWTIDGSIKILP
jgi:hypothetical protein